MEAAKQHAFAAEQMKLRRNAMRADVGESSTDAKTSPVVGGGAAGVHGVRAELAARAKPKVGLPKNAVVDTTVVSRGGESALIKKRASMNLKKMTRATVLVNDKWGWAK